MCQNVPNGLLGRSGSDMSSVVHPVAACCSVLDSLLGHGGIDISGMLQRDAA